MSDQLYQQFQNPSAAWRAKPFWSWNGKLEKDELLRQLHVIQQMGCGGYFMHSRTGLITEYLGEEWMNLINICADEGAKLGMESWLYDEDRWPSGTAGGSVTKNPKYSLRFLYMKPMKPSEFSWNDSTINEDAANGNIIAAFVCKLDGLNYTDLKQLQRGQMPEANDHLTVLRVTVEIQESSSFYNGFTYVDTLNREAIDLFIELTHEKYLKACGDRIGTSIRGVFTDEPHRGALMDGFSLGNENPQWRAPWTFKLFDEFKKTWGYDLVPKLPELFLRPEGNIVSQVKWHYVELLQQMFLENFAKPLDEWHQKHNMILTGHVLHEDSLSAQTAMQGSMMRFYEYMGYPGVDVLCEHNKNYWIVKQISSAARQLGQEWLLSELDGCTGWQMPFAGHKAIGDWQVLLGINVRCPHLSWYTMEGEAKRDFPASIFHQSAWWTEYHYLETYFARLGLMMSQGTPCCDTLVMNPIESVWCQIYPGWARNLGATSPTVLDLEEKYRQMFHWLMGAQIDFDYGDEAMIAQRWSIEKADDGVPQLRIGKAVYKTIVVGGMTTIRQTTVNILEAFIQAGGKVIFAGDAPSYVDAVESIAAKTLANKSISISFDQEAVVKAVEAVVPVYAKAICPETGKTLNDIFVQVRKDGQRFIMMALNVDREHPIKAKIQLNATTLKGAQFIEEWDSLTGAQSQILSSMNHGLIEFTTTFAAGGEHLFIIQPTKNTLPLKSDTAIIEQQEILGPFEYRLNEPNLCVLDFAEYRIGNGNWQERKEVLKVDQSIRSHFGLPYRGGEMLQPWFVKQKETIIKDKVTLRFSFNIETMPKTPIELVMERPENFTTQINGNRLSPITDAGWWCDKVFRRLPIPATWLKMGYNEITIETAFHQGSDLEAMYLLGNFGVRLDGPGEASLISLPEYLAIGDLVSQGLPFYSAGISYIIPSKLLKLCPQANEFITLALPSTGAACSKVVGDHGEKPILWAPYEVDITQEVKNGNGFLIETVLTRRNTFGPLHQMPKVCSGYGPGNYVTEGPGFTEMYQLYPSGLLSAPLIQRRKNV